MSSDSGASGIVSVERLVTFFSLSQMVFFAAELSLIIFYATRVDSAA